MLWNLCGNRRSRLEYLPRRDKGCANARHLQDDGQIVRGGKEGEIPESTSDKAKQARTMLTDIAFERDGEIGQIFYQIEE